MVAAIVAEAATAAAAGGNEDISNYPSKRI